jgi:hypothetical protein
VFCAVSVLAIEMQIVTWTGIGTLRQLVAVNAVLAVLLFVGRQADLKVGLSALLVEAGLQAGPRASVSPPAPADESRRTGANVAAVLMMGALVTVLNLGLPLTAADPYHLERVASIAAHGTLSYDPAAHPTVNVMGGLYELMLADARQIPAAGETVVRLHGVWSLLLYVLAVSVVLHATGASQRWSLAFLLTVPVAFHQLVLIKNDLFGAIPVLLVLTWLAVRMPSAVPVEFAWAAWLTGVALGTKLINFPLALVAAAAVLICRRVDARVLAWAACGIVAGVLSSGVLVTLTENARLYGNATAPFQEIGSRTEGIADSSVSIARFGISLFDLGLLTRTYWPGRGGWGSTFGLPLIWAIVVLACCARRDVDVRRTVAMVGAYWLISAAIYTDSDIAHRRILAPGLLLIAIAVARAGRQDAPAWMPWSAAAVMVLSAAQIARSAMLYFAR